MTDEGFTVFNNRELKLLKTYMGHHGWKDLMVGMSCETEEQLHNKFKMTDIEINMFRSKLGI